MNRQAKKHHLSSFELLQLLIDEQGSTLIQQLCITVLTAEYDGGTRTIERFLKAVAYDVIELFVCLYYKSKLLNMLYKMLNSTLAINRVSLAYSKANFLRLISIYTKL
ncbi:hypothetical protein T4D_9250 [Trichinella pseudospiralis]|uniref:Uncharacterized protein n=1 Tax=Trichinella pseudospiralis TaxID=6337 RepID=A0A0V1F970_TRIPS|nr:hypothetical protein T4D_9250 [Trichinella pseudospiralis]